MDGGDHAGQRGYLVLGNVPSGRHARIHAKLGDFLNRAGVNVSDILPEQTALLPNSSTRVPVVAVLGCRVLVIGPDEHNSDNYIGMQGFVSMSPYPIDPSCAFVTFHNGGEGGILASYFTLKNLCLSTVGPSEWRGSFVN